MTPTTSSTVSAATTEFAGQRPRRVWRQGALAATAAAGATTVYALIIDAAGIPMVAGQIGANTALALTPANFAFGAALSTIIGTLIAAACSRWAFHPARRFTGIAGALTALSLITPIFAGATETATKCALIGAHLLAAAVAIPIITRGLRTSGDRPRTAVQP